MDELSPSQYKTLIRQGSDVISIVSEDGTIRYQSPNSSAIKGWEPDELVGENMFEYIHPDDRRRVVMEFRPLVTASGYIEKQIEFRFRTKDDGWIWLEVTGTAPGPDEPIDGYITTSRDISARKEREQELEETKRELARSNARLEQRNDHLEAFTGMVSHDLRNPLNVAQGHSEIISESLETAVNEDGSDGPLDTETVATVRDAADTVSRALSRMERLIDDLLVLAREGQSIDEVEPVSLASTAQTCWEMVERHDATLSVGEDLTVVADPDRLRQLLENLFRNAVEHGGENVTIRVGALPDATGFYVEDDGPGIPEENRSEIFDAGFTTNRDGTGFGLAIVSEIAEAHGWTVTLGESESGGARFEITAVELPE